MCVSARACVCVCVCDCVYAGDVGGGVIMKHYSEKKKTT